MATGRECASAAPSNQAMKANRIRKRMMAVFGTQDADRTVAPVTPAVEAGDDLRGYMSYD
jgi:hypothetical protein